MKQLALIIILGCLLCSCSNYKDKEAIAQIQYSRTHTGYADSAAMRYALDHQISPDSAVVVLGGAKK